MPPRFSYRQITVLNTIFKRGSASAAAEHLNISQPAVSKLISSLEQEFGYKLFYRTGRKLRPTAEAEMLIPFVERALNEMDRLTRGAEAVGSGSIGHVSIASNYTLTEAVAMPAVIRFKKKHSNVSVSILSMSAPDIVGSLVNGNADVGIAYTPVQHSQLSYEVIGSWGCVCVFPKSHEFRASETIKPQQLHNKNVVTFSEQVPTGVGIRKFFQNAGMELHPDYMVNTTPIALNIVNSLGCVGLVDTFEPFKELYPDLCSRPLSPMVENQLTVFTSQTARTSGLVRELLGEIRSVFPFRADPEHG